MMTNSFEANQRFLQSKVRELVTMPKKNISDLTPEQLDPYIGKALGHCGAHTGIMYHQSAQIASQLFLKYGESIQRFADGFYATMKHGAGLFTMQDKDPIIAIYKAYVVSRLGDEIDTSTDLCRL